MISHQRLMQPGFPEMDLQGAGLLFFLEANMIFKRICIDPGHGGDDNGAAWGHAEEDDINLGVAFLLRCELEKRGKDVVMTREKDAEVSLEDRCKFANGEAADLFVSIHCDAWHQETVSGISTYMYRGGNYLSEGVARSVHRALTDRFPKHVNRGIKPSGFFVLKRTIMPAILVECEFISHPDQRRFLKEPENQLAIARAIARGIVKNKPRIDTNKHE
jgi:N-acetylmuramoyl-L-alanine amidase